MPWHPLARAGVRMIRPVMGHFSESTAVSSTIRSSSESSAAPPVPPRALGPPPRDRSRCAFALANKGGAGTRPFTSHFVRRFATRRSTANGRVSWHVNVRRLVPATTAFGGMATGGSRPAFPIGFPARRYITGSGCPLTRSAARKGQCSRAGTGSSSSTHAIWSSYRSEWTFRSFAWAGVTVNGRSRWTFLPCAWERRRVGGRTTPGVLAILGSSAAAQNGSAASARCHTLVSEPPPP